MKKGISLMLATLLIVTIFFGCTKNKNGNNNNVIISESASDIITNTKNEKYHYSKPDIYIDTDFDKEVIDFYDDYLFLTKDSLYLYDHLEYKYRVYKLSYTPKQILFFDGITSTSGDLFIENTDNTYSTIKVNLLEDVSKLTDIWDLSGSPQKVALEGFTINYEGQFVSVVDTFDGLRYIYFKNGDIHSLKLNEDTLEITKDEIINKSTKLDILTDPVKKLPKTAFTIAKTYPGVITSDNVYYHCTPLGEWMDTKAENVNDIFTDYTHISNSTPVFTKNNDNSKLYKLEHSDGWNEIELTYNLPDEYKTENIKNIFYTSFSDIYIEFDDSSFYIGKNNRDSTPKVQSIEISEALSQLNKDKSIKKISISNNQIIALLDDGVVYKNII